MSDLLSLHEAMARLRAVGYATSIVGKELHAEQSRRGTKTVNFIPITDGKVWASDVKRVQGLKKF